MTFGAPKGSLFSILFVIAIYLIRDVLESLSVPIVRSSGIIVKMVRGWLLSIKTNVLMVLSEQVESQSQNGCVSVMMFLFRIQRLKL